MVPASNTRPTIASVKRNATLTFSATFNFSPDATYQWQKDGIAIADANTAVFTTTITDPGTYTVTIKNDTQSITSAPATVKIAE